MGNSLTTCGKPSQRRERRFLERLSNTYAQTHRKIEFRMMPLLGLSRNKKGSSASPPLSPDKKDRRAVRKIQVPIDMLPNEMWLEVMSYLSYNDLKQLRMVSWHCYDLVNRRKLMYQGKVIVTRHNLAAIKEHVENAPSKMTFERMELRNLKQSPKLDSFLKLVGPEVRHLQVSHAPVFRNINGKMPNLKVLTIAASNVFDDTLGINLKQFINLEAFECDGVSLDSTLKISMLLQLRKPANKVRLRHLQFEFTHDNEEVLVAVLRDHAETLEYIDIFFSCAPSVDVLPWCLAFEEMRNLSILKLSGNCHLLLLESILVSVPKVAPLRQLDLTGMLSLTNDLFLYVASKWEYTLKSLDLMFCVQLNSACIDALRQLSGQLKCLTMAYCREMTGVALLKGIAYKPNYIIQELHLEEVCFIDEESLCELLVRLYNLRRLSLDNCRQAVTDRTMSLICKYQTSLRQLNIEYCIKITDKGFLGCPEFPYPITRLRGLRELNLRGCKNLTDRVLKEALILPELRVLSLGYCSFFYPEGFEALTHNAPAIETLCVASCMKVDDDTVRHFMRNLKRLRSINISNCMRLTLQSIHHILRHGHNMVELIACSIDGMDQEQAQRLLEKQRPQMKQVLL
ncbi:dynein regulatory complex subunit 6 [Drosophila obscura]|uniref:dynein regulatory complex subunit 6 n=1 Tax=Drosophila obscura TaxID=7282 RepID=UPI000BA03279|nr:dynein regulatory complex subunit 6 [Drosophila obscura]